MKTILKDILEIKKKEIAVKKRTGGEFLQAIFHPIRGKISIIAEIKMQSPIEGILGIRKNLNGYLREYKNSADMISVVTDRKYFGGSMEMIGKIKKRTKLPVLVKEFIIDPIQIYEAKFYGASALLLISRLLTRRKLNHFVELVNSLGMEPVVEIDHEDELDKAIETKTKIIAVNARNLSDFSIDIDKAVRIIQKVPQDRIPLAFSGVLSECEVERYYKAGAKGVLVGTSLMKAGNKSIFLNELRII